MPAESGRREHRGLEVASGIYGKIVGDPTAFPLPGDTKIPAITQPR
jgi:hypothetical protein